ncbi:MAG: MoaD/ThiS family protein [Minisyncoccales bacterium]
MEDFLKPIKIKIFYDENLKKITGKNFEEAVVSEGMTFVNQLYFIFSSYPEIEKRYPPGKLGLLLNNRPPKDFDILRDGDEIILKTA